jgi:hypothetical protein
MVRDVPPSHTHDPLRNVGRQTVASLASFIPEKNLDQPIPTAL